MNASLIPTIVLSLFLVCIILGFLFGWFRGFSKSLVRFIILLAVTVLAFFVVPSITKAVLKMDISKWNINIDGVQVITLGDLIIDMLEKIPVVQELIESSPTFEEVITLAPQMIANVVLFIAFFFIFKWVSMVIYWIIAGVFFSKKKMGDKDRHKFIGAVIGTVQGFMIAIVLMVPIFGMVETTRPVMQAIQAEQQANASSGSEVTPSGFVYNVDGEGSGTEAGGEEANEPKAPTLGEVSDESMKYINAFDNTWLVKVLKAVRISDMSVAMFDSLTTVKDRDLEIQLRKEMKIVADAYPGLSGLISGDANLEDANTYDSLKSAFDKLYESPVLSGIVSEIVPAAASRWSDPTVAEENRVFCGIPKPKFQDTSTNRVFDALLLNLSTQTDKNEIKKDVDTSIDVMKLCCSSGIVTAVKHNGDIMEVLLRENNKNLVSDIIDLSLKSKTLGDCLPDIINMAMNQLYKALAITDAPEITLKSNEVNWETEKVLLQNVFNNVLKLYDGIKKGTDAGKDALDSIDFASLGRAFDGLRLSQLLSAGSLSIMTKLMDSDFIVGADASVLATFKDKMTAVWTDSTVKMEDTFVAIQNALVLAKNLKNASTEITPDNIGNIVNGLKENETLKDTVNELLNNEETMKNLGLDQTTAGVVKETISSVINYEYKEGEDIQKDIDAISEVYNVANKVMSAGVDSQVNLDTTETNKLVEKIAESTVIKDNLTKAGSKVGNLDYSKLSNESKTNIAQSINDNQTLSTEEKNALKALFGIGA